MFLPDQQQVVDEKSDLDQKTIKLSAFIFANPMFRKLDASEQERMKNQVEIMLHYSEILGARIAAFNPAERQRSTGRERRFNHE